MTRDSNPDRLDDGARAEAEMKEREAPQTLVERIDDAIPLTFEKIEDGYYDTPLTFLLRDIRTALNELNGGANAS